MDVSVASMASSFGCLWKSFASMNRRTKQPEMDRRATFYRKAFVALEPAIAEPGVASAIPGLASSSKAFLPTARALSVL